MPEKASFWAFTLLLAFSLSAEIANAAGSGCDLSLCREDLKQKRIALQNRVYFSVGIIETSHVGAFDRYVGPWVKKRVKKFFGIGGKKSSSSGGGTGGGGINHKKLFDIILPSGKLPHDFSWTYHFRPGLKLALDYESDLFYPLTGRIMRFTAFVLHDRTDVTLKAPSGFGILIDPTYAKLHADFYGAGVKVTLPVLSKQFGNWNWDTHLGGGLFAYHSRSYYHVKSAFLDIVDRETRNRVKPLLSFSSTLYKPVLSIAGQTTETEHKASLAFGMDVFQTDYFWTATASLNAKFRF